MSSETEIDTADTHTGHRRAVLQALFVTFLWSTSWVLIRIGLEDIPSLTFAGLRYTLAFVVLLAYAARTKRLPAFKNFTKRTWVQLIVLGLLFYSVTQGAMFVALDYLEAITVNLVLSFTTVLVAFMGIALLNERPTGLQWAGTGLYLVGVVLYFYPLALPAGEAIGFAAVIVGLVANAVSAVLGRQINRALTLSPTAVTVVSMGIGGVVLLAGGTAVQGFPRLTLANWAIVLWLAVVNSAFAFTLWNRTLRTLPAMESSLINNTMMIQIPILAWLFLEEQPSALELAGMALAAVGIFAVQMRRR